MEEYKSWNKELFDSIKADDPNVGIKLKPMIRLGIPNQFKRETILKLFNVIKSDAKSTYAAALKVVYGVIIILV